MQGFGVDKTVRLSVGHSNYDYFFPAAGKSSNFFGRNLDDYLFFGQYSSFDEC